VTFGVEVASSMIQPLSEILGILAGAFADNGEVFGLASRTEEGDTPLHMAIWGGHEDWVQILVDAGADVQAVGDRLETPLHVAARKGSVKMALVLVGADANPDAPAQADWTPRKHATRVGGDIEAFFNTLPLNTSAHADILTSRAPL